jgi:hypothetical protein
MPDNPATATPPAIDMAALTKSIIEQVTPSLIEGLKPVIAEQIKAAVPAPVTPAPATKDAKPEALTAEAVAKIVADQIAAASQANGQKAARDAFQAEKLKDLPAAYRNQLGSDPAKWAAEEQAIREQFKADLKAAGLEPKNVGGAAKEGGKTAEQNPVDKSKIDPVSRIEMGLK